MKTATRSLAAAAISPPAFPAGYSAAWLATPCPAVGCNLGGVDVVVLRCGIRKPPRNAHISGWNLGSPVWCACAAGSENSRGPLTVAAGPWAPPGQGCPASRLLLRQGQALDACRFAAHGHTVDVRSEEHTSELQSLRHL